MTDNVMDHPDFYFIKISVIKSFFSVERQLDKVSVELILVKLAHKKRKESSSPYVQSPLGSTEVQVNPSDDHPPSKAPALSIPSESFNLANGHHIKSCSLLVRVHHTSLSQVVILDIIFSLFPALKNDIF